MARADPAVTSMPAVVDHSWSLLRPQMKAGSSTAGEKSVP